MNYLAPDMRPSSGLLHVLILEDCAADAELISRELRRAGFLPDWTQAASREDYLTALDVEFDVILADYTLPGFNALDALAALKERGLTTPFIVITGSVGDELAAECIKQGATDYLLKDRMNRLGPAITRALAERKQADQRQHAQWQLRIAQEQIAETLRNANAGLEQRVADRTHALTEAHEKLQQETADRLKAEAALTQAQKMEAIGQLTGGIAHDFNNLLQVIVSNLDILALQPEIAGQRKLTGLIDAALAGVKRSDHVVKGLLAFGRRQTLAPAPFDVNALVQHMADLLDRLLGETIQMRTLLAPSLSLVLADAHQLENALLNLALNARDAMPHGGRLTISTENMDGFVRIMVSDTGCGMTDYVLAHALEPFFTTKEVGQGSGLGLSQVYGYANQSGGQMTIESLPGEGTKIILLLPGADASVSPQQKDAATAHTKPVTVLVVEDERFVRMAVVCTLEEYGYQVIATENALAAIEVLQSDMAVDLMLSDVIMPGAMNGVELADVANRLRPGIKVLLTSGYTRHALGEKHHLSTQVPILHKPYRAEDLAQQLEDMMADDCAGRLAGMVH